MLRYTTPILLSDLEPRQLAPTLGHGVYRTMMQMVISSTTGGGSIPAGALYSISSSRFNTLFVLFIFTTSKELQTEDRRKAGIHTRTYKENHGPSGTMTWKQEANCASTQGHRHHPPRRRLGPRGSRLYLYTRPPAPSASLSSRTTTSAVRLIVVSDLGPAEWASSATSSLSPMRGLWRCLLHHRHAWPPASSSRTVAVVVRLVVDFGLVFSATRRWPL